MVDIKEIKSVRIVPFTLMSSSVSAVLGIIYAIILMVVLGILGLLIPEMSQVGGLLAAIGVGMIFILPIGFFLLNILSSFMVALVYNLLVPRVGGIKVGMHDMKEVRSIAVIPISLITSLIYTVLTLLAMLIIGPLLAILFQGASLASLSNVAEMPEISGIGTFGAVIAVILVIGVPIIVFISSFISMALTALFYNLIAPKIGGVKFKFKDASHSFCEIKKIPALPLALISSVVLTIVNLIFSLPSFAGYLISGEILLGFGYLIGNIIGNFLSILILYAIMAAIYNFLRPKIGGVEIELD